MNLYELKISDLTYCSNVAMQWIFGLFIALIVGSIVTGSIVAISRGRFSIFFRGLFMGLLERFFFTLAIAFNIPGVGVAMLAWITAKMAANWNNRKPLGDVTVDDLKHNRLSALQCYNLMFPPNLSRKLRKSR